MLPSVGNNPNPHLMSLVWYALVAPEALIERFMTERVKGPGLSKVLLMLVFYAKPYQ